MAPDDDRNARIRAATFAFLRDLRVRRGDEPFLRTDLERGFDFEGVRVPLVGPPGIFKPRTLTDAPLTITTKPVVEGRERPYDDELGTDGLLRYRYRGVDPMHPDNVGLRRAMLERIPLIYFYGIVPGRYEAAWPVFVVGDDPAALTFSVSVDDVRALVETGFAVRETDVAARREYVTRITQQRLHQRDFRERVLGAYREQCALCKLRHRELLDAAHILPDSDPRSEPRISSGLSLCKIHHAAFDNNFVSIRPDYVIEVRPSILSEDDGPMLQHGLKELHGRSLVAIPRREDQRPNPDFLEERFSEFRRHA